MTSKVIKAKKTEDKNTIFHASFIAIIAIIAFFSSSVSKKSVRTFPVSLWNASIIPTIHIRKSQWTNLHNLRFLKSDIKANPLLGFLDVETLCTPICLDNHNWASIQEVVDPSAIDSECESTKQPLKKYFTGGYFLLHQQLALGLVVPLLHKKGFEDIFPLDAFQCIEKSYTAVGLVILTDGHTSGIPDDVRKCFTHIDFVKVDKKYRRHSKLSSLLQLLHNDKIVNKYQHIFWVNDKLRPLSPLWVNFLENEVHDSSRFYIKGSPKTSMDGTDFLQQSFSFSVTLNSLMMDENLVIGLWNGKFVEFLRDLLAESLQIPNLIIEDNIAKVVLTYMLHNLCNAKLFLPHIQYRNIVSISHGTQIQDKKNTAIFSLDATGAVQDSSVNGNISNLHKPLNSLFSNEELSCGDSLDQHNVNLLVEKQYNIGKSSKLQRGCLGQLNLQKIHSQQQLIKSNFSNPTKASPSDTIQTMTHTMDHQRKILITIVFGGRQYKSLLYSLARWELSAYAPCAAEYNKDSSSNIFASSLMFLQSGTKEEDVLNELKIDIAEFPAIARCFSNIHYNFLTLPRSEYNDGPPNMFREMVLGKYSKQYDYVMQFEPDMFPIRPMWLTKIYNETLDQTPFWMKGTIGMYFESYQVGIPDFVGSCLVGTQVNNTHAIQQTPPSSRLLHINGNSLYSLSPSFKNFVKEFFKWAETSAGCNCPRSDRIHCFSDAELCIGSFDTSLADYLFLNLERMRKQTLIHYRYSPMIINSMNPKYYPGCITSDAYFIHKAWFAFKFLPEWFKTCSTDEPYFKEFYWYSAYGDPGNIIDVSIDQNHHPKDIIGILKHMNSLFEIM